MNAIRILFWACATLAIVACGSNGARVVNDILGADPLVAFESYLLKPSYEAPKISPDGKHITVLAQVDGVSNLMLADIEQPTALRALTHNRGRGLQAHTIWDEPTFRWAENGKYVFYIRDDKGDENWVLYSLDITSGESRQLTPAQGVRVRGLQISAKFPDEVLFGMNDKSPTQIDYYRANAVTGEVKHIASAAPYLLKLFDSDFNERVALSLDKKDLARVIYVRDTDGNWKEFNRVMPEDAEALSSNHINDVGGAVITRTKLLTFSNQGLDTTTWVSFDLATGKRDIIGLDRRVDIKRALVHPGAGTPQAYMKNFTTAEWVVVAPALQNDFDSLRAMNYGELEFESRTRDDQKWIVRFMRPDYPVRYFLYDRGSGKATALGVSAPQLAELKLSNMFPLVTRSSDGFDLVSYIAYPSWVKLDANGIPSSPQPVITVVHGGPSDERAQFGFSPMLQWMTNRGYAVFVVNFRGSPGFGKAFMNAQRHEWGGAMNRDVIDQVKYLVDRKIADPKRMAVFGGSYGGYETLVAMTMSPGVFACGNAVVGPSNLETFIDPSKLPPDWSPDLLFALLGDPRTEEGRKLLKERSPLNHASQTRGQMLIVQGANDARVPTRESEQVVDAMQKAGVKVTYLLYPDEGHGIIRKENNRSFHAISEVFFGECLGGRYSSMRTEALEGSSVKVPVGVEHIPGLKKALESRRNDGMLQMDTSIDSATFGEFAGSYDLRGYKLTVRLEGKQLFVDLPG
jgi:dipeptidyl aminopeptidase/acylaminoacyl peptidase